jgi:hypothetical protein
MVYQTLKTKNKMKTTKNISNLKKLALIACMSLVISTASFAGNHAAKEAMESAARLEATMNATEASVKFIAPAVNESYEAAMALANLEMLADATEASLKYAAPAVDENAEAECAAERLALLAATTEAAIMYQAPSATEMDEVLPAMERLALLADSTETAMRYEAPAVDSIPAVDQPVAGEIEILFAHDYSLQNQ